MRFLFFFLAFVVFPLTARAADSLSVVPEAAYATAAGHVLRGDYAAAEAVLARFHCGQGTDNESVRKGLDLVQKTPPSWDVQAGTIDFYYWYFGTLANQKAGGDRWRRWSEGIRDSVASHQRGPDSGCARGSWDPADPWGPDGGRVYSTAINVLTLEAYVRTGAVGGGK